MKIVLALIGLGFTLFTFGQQETTLASADAATHEISASEPTRFKGSESPEAFFIVSPNLKENKLVIETNYEHSYRVRFIDYWGKSKIVYKDNYRNKEIMLDEFKESIFIMNIVDENSNKLLTSQVLNLKRRNY